MTPTPNAAQLLRARMEKLGIHELPPAVDTLPPTQDELPYDDGEPMESPWHASAGPLLKESYVAFRGGRMDDFFIGVNMFFYYSTRQVRNQDYKGPDLFFVKHVDGTRDRLSWLLWEEHGRFPNVIIELLSSSTEASDLGEKKQLYEQTFRTPEYFCIAPEVERLLGWRLREGNYTPIAPDARGWLWSEELGLYIGKWHGTYLGAEHIWPRFYHLDGTLVLTSAEAERRRAATAEQRAETAEQRAATAEQRAETAEQRAETAEQRANDLAARMAALEAELKRLRGSEPTDE